MAKTITKSILSTGDMFVHANGKVSTVILGTIGGDILRFHTDKNSFSYLSNYTENLAHVKHSGLDVVSVYRSTNPDDKKRGDEIFNPSKMIKDSNLLGTISRIPFVSGDMFVHANGKVSTLFRGVPTYGDILRFHTEFNSFSLLSNFDITTGKHKDNSKYDIVAVYRAPESDPKTFGDAICNPSKMVSDDNLFMGFITQNSASLSTDTNTSTVSSSSIAGSNVLNSFGTSSLSFSGDDIVKLLAAFVSEKIK